MVEAKAITSAIILGSLDVKITKSNEGSGQKKNCEKAVRLTTWVDPPPPPPSPKAVRKM